MITMNRHFAWSIATDTANRNMRKNHRKAWNEDDYNLAVDTFNLIWKEIPCNK